MGMRLCLALLGLLLFGPLTMWGQTSSQVVRFRTSLGDIDVQLLPESAPATVQNFLNYMNRGDYNNSFFHRSVQNFIIQGGGFAWRNGVVAIPQDPPVVNEPRVSNTRGTIAMAKLGNNPNSATNQWFFNLGNNASNLDNQNGGFTVFGRVVAGLDIMDRIAAVPRYDASNVNGAFNELPLLSQGQVTEANLVRVLSIALVEGNNPPPATGNRPSINAGGIITASGFGGAPTVAPGSFIEIYGTDLAGTTRGWTEADFRNGEAPTSLEGVSVSFGVRRAYVAYVSPNLVNVQVPAETVPGTPVAVTLTYNGQTSVSRFITAAPRQGGMLAPPVLRVGDKQYIAAYRPDGSLIGNGSIEGVPNRPVEPGEVIVFYGVGFGAVNGAPWAGQIATGLASLTTPVEILFNNTPARVDYAGLAPSFVGLYQFNVVVPPGLPSGDVTITVRQAGTATGQTLYLPVK